MRLLLALVLVTAAVAQESIPARGRAEDYKVHVSAGPHLIAAEYQARTVPAPSGSFLLRDYVAVEIAVFPAGKESFRFDTGTWSLRCNGKKEAILAQTPGMVAASLKYSQWDEGPRMTAAAGMGDKAVILGRDRSSRFPGDRRAPTPPVGTPEKIPGPAGGIEREPEIPAWDWVAKLAWADGPVNGPAGGLLYFPYRGNLAKIKSLELVYLSPSGEVSLKLR